MDKIKQQANVVSHLLFSADTGSTYQKALARTWEILKETGLLLWLVLCLVFVGGEWFYRNSVQSGRRARLWYNSLSEKGEASAAAASQPMGTTGQALLASLQSGTAYLLSQARRQLGLQDPPPPVPPARVPPPPVVEPPKPAVTPPTPRESSATTDSDLDESL